jgi:hypothetical protein
VEKEEIERKTKTARKGGFFWYNTYYEFKNKKIYCEDEKWGLSPFTPFTCPHLPHHLPRK